MATIWIPSLMRDLTAGQERVDVPGRRVSELIEALEAAYPGFRDRVCEGERLAPAISVWVDGHIAPLGLRQAVDEGSEIQFLPAVAGG
jgi:molybdopterin synthase sulfur carrier subunit